MTAPVAMVNAAVETFVRAAAQELEDVHLMAVCPPMVRETAAAMGRDAPWAAPAALVAEAYVRAVEEPAPGEIVFVEGPQP